MTSVSFPNSTAIPSRSRMPEGTWRGSSARGRMACVRGLAVCARGEVRRRAVTDAAVDEHDVTGCPERGPGARDPTGTELTATLSARLGAGSCHQGLLHVLLLGHLGDLDDQSAVHVDCLRLGRLLTWFPGDSVAHRPSLVKCVYW